ncbi:unnamed protein product, partial [Ectocarpus sp. 12 AP-2014]
GDSHRDKESEPRGGHASPSATNSSGGFAAIDTTAAVLATAFVHPDPFSLVLAPGNSRLSPPSVGGWYSDVNFADRAGRARDVRRTASRKALGYAAAAAAAAVETSPEII